MALSRFWQRQRAVWIASGVVTLLPVVLVAATSTADPNSTRASLTVAFGPELAAYLSHAPHGLVMAVRSLLPLGGLYLLLAAARARYADGTRGSVRAVVRDAAPGTQPARRPVPHYALPVRYATTTGVLCACVLIYACGGASTDQCNDPNCGSGGGMSSGGAVSGGGTAAGAGSSAGSGSDPGGGVPMCAPAPAKPRILACANPGVGGHGVNRMEFTGRLQTIEPSVAACPGHHSQERIVGTGTGPAIRLVVGDGTATVELMLATPGLDEETFDVGEPLTVTVQHTILQYYVPWGSVVIEDTDGVAVIVTHSEAVGGMDVELGDLTCYVNPWCLFPHHDTVVTIGGQTRTIAEYESAVIGGYLVSLRDSHDTWNAGCAGHNKNHDYTIGVVRK